MNEDRTVIRLYKLGMSMDAIAKRMGFKSHVSILNRLNRLCVKKRTRSEIMLGERRALKHSYNENFFNSVETQGQAYALGLIVSDGWVCLSRGYRIGFFSMDKCLVDTLSFLFRATNPISPTRSGGWSLVISSKKLVDGLKKYGCVKRKSKTATWPILPKKMRHHYIRGLFDGDGCVRIDNKGNARFSICGSLPIISKLALLFNARPLRHGSIWKVDISGNHRVYSIGRYMYRGARFYLPRKKEIFDSIKLKYRKEVSCPKS